MFCKNCGAKLNKNANFCEYCGCPVKENTQSEVKHSHLNNDNYNEKSKKFIQIVQDKNNQNSEKSKIKFPYLFVIFIFVIIVVIITFISILISENQTVGVSDVTSNTVTETNESEQRKIYEDNYIKVNYIDCSKFEDSNNAAYLKLLFENKSNKNITVSLEDVTVNGLIVLTGGFTPNVFSPGESSQEHYTLYTGESGINSAEVDNISLKISILDNDTSEVIEETEQIEIDVKQ